MDLQQHFLTLLATIIGFLALLVGAMMLFSVSGTVAGSLGGMGSTALLSFGAIVVALAILPVMFLKKLAHMSRDIEHDDSNIRMREFAKDQQQPKMILHR